MSYPEGLASISKTLKEAGVKVVVVVVGDVDNGLENVRQLASGDKFILTVGSPDRLKIMVQQAVDKIMQGEKTNQNVNNYSDQSQRTQVTQ